MKKIFLSACILLAVTQITKAQKGFKPLFDGKTTTGWHTYNKTTVGSAWQVQDGALHLDPAKKGQDGGGDLVTDQEYSNFHLKLDWKVAPKSNSGIIFFVHEDPKFHATYSTGPEMQVLDNDGHPDGKITKHRSGDLYDLIKSYSEPVKPVGQWNTAEIISKNGKLTLMLNGVKTVNTTMWDENWKALIAGSKFATWEGFGTYKTGKIALQDHGDEVWFKNIVIKEL
ncbi:DUF1080 domain-containing protein [Pedobacter nototheniae]|uniref:3-keto-disaccharide hydrolase n=1 Tax=Pedobacter nototheniae TaxID=2488994 RepID=UPI002930F50E|nr:DUF1080 domain-containing protein [Pedobacter nototheniae]